jgi:hypothetical protein
MIIAPKKALQNPSTRKAGNIWETKSSRSALTTNINIPIVTIMKGMLRSRSTGRTKALMIPKRREAPAKVPTLEQ